MSDKKRKASKVEVVPPEDPEEDEAPELVGEDEEEGGELEIPNYYETLAPSAKRRVAALEKLQDKVTEIKSQFDVEHEKLLEKYNKLRQPIFQKRLSIISGSYEPTQQDLPKDFEQPENTDKEEEPSKGIPEFWFHVVKNCPLASHVGEEDEEALKYLTNITVDSTKTNHFEIQFHFRENPFFENQVLKRNFKCSENQYGELLLNHTEGTTIKWKPAHNPEKTQVEMTFFKNISLPPLSEKSEEEIEKLDEEEQTDYIQQYNYWREFFDDACLVRDSIIPNPTLWFKAPPHDLVQAMDASDDEDGAFGFGGEGDDDDDDEEDEEEEEEDEAPKKKQKSGKNQSVSSKNKTKTVNNAQAQDKPNECKQQ